jgi:hypothetical protein
MILKFFLNSFSSHFIFFFSALKEDPIEINARANTLNDTGSGLLKNNHYMSDDINSNLKGMANNNRNSSIIITRMKRKNNENNEDSIAKKLNRTVSFNLPLTDTSFSKPAVIILSDDDVEIANDDSQVKDINANASFSKTEISEPLINNSSRKRSIITSSDDDVEVTNDDNVVKDIDVLAKTKLYKPLNNNSLKKRTTITSSDDDIEVTNNDNEVKDHDTVFAKSELFADDWYYPGIVQASFNSEFKVKFLNGNNNTVSLI